MNSMPESPDLWSLLRNRSLSYHNQPALTSASGDLTFEQLFTEADRLSQSFRSLELHPQHVVALALPNSPELSVSILALIRSSAITALIPQRTVTHSDMKTVCQQLRPHCFVTDQATARRLKTYLVFARIATIQTRPGAEPLQILFLSQVGQAGEDTVQKDRLKKSAVVKLTKGTTGAPKGVAVSADNLIAEMSNVAHGLELLPGDRIYACVPLTHSYGFDLGILASLWSGATLVIRNGYWPRRVLSELEACRISVLLGTPSMYRHFNRIPLRSLPSLGHVRYFLSCTAPLPDEVLEGFYQRFGAVICQHYGTSETGALTNHRPDRVREKRTSVGCPLPGVELTIRDAEGRELPQGERGQVVARSGVVSLGYLVDNDTELSPFRNGAYWTGDSGAFDVDGFLYLYGRQPRSEIS